MIVDICKIPSKKKKGSEEPQVRGKKIRERGETNTKSQKYGPFCPKLSNFWTFLSFLPPFFFLPDFGQEKKNGIARAAGGRSARSKCFFSIH
jgi:hypothetical protein